MNVEVSTHQAHREMLRAYFTARAFRVIRWQDIERLVGRNYQQRISDLRRSGFNVENVPRFMIRRDAEGRPMSKRATGDYRHRPEALGRDAADLVDYKQQTIFDTPSGWQR